MERDWMDWAFLPSDWIEAGLKRIGVPEGAATHLGPITQLAMIFGAGFYALSQTSVGRDMIDTVFGNEDERRRRRDEEGQRERKERQREREEERKREALRR
jgi:hypothetical protein